MIRTVVVLLLTIVVISTMSDNLKKVDRAKFRDRVKFSSDMNPKISHRQDYSESNQALILNLTNSFLLDLHECHLETGYSYTSILDAQINTVSLFQTNRLENILKSLFSGESQETETDEVW